MCGMTDHSLLLANNMLQCTMLWLVYHDSLDKLLPLRAPRIELVLAKAHNLGQQRVQRHAGVLPGGQHHLLCCKRTCQ